MTRRLFPLSLLIFFISCGEESTSTTTVESTNNTSDTTVVTTDTIEQTDLIDDIIPEDIYELDTLTLSDDFITDFTGNGVFYCFDDSVAYRDFATNKTKHIATQDLNGKDLSIEKVYRISFSEYYSECCDPWSEEEFCLYYCLVKVGDLYGYFKGDYLFRMPEYSPGKVDLLDEVNGREYSFYQAEGFRGCYNGLLMVESGDSTFSMIKLKEPEYNTGILDFFGEWVSIREFFMRDDKPVVVMTFGVDGNYSYYFYELSEINGEYIADNYFYTDIMATLDEFDNGFDFDSVLHEEYRLEFDGEDFESSW